MMTHEAKELLEISSPSGYIGIITIMVLEDCRVFPVVLIARTRTRGRRNSCSCPDRQLELRPGTRQMQSMSTVLAAVCSSKRVLTYRFHRPSVEPHHRHA